MPVQQRLLKLFIRLMLPVFALGGFGSLASLFLVGSGASHVVDARWSSSGHYRATISEVFTSAGCGRGDSSVVTVERRSFYFYTGQFTPFCSIGKPDRITIRWQNDETLLIECSGCLRNYVYADQNWGKLRFVYDLDKP